MSFARRSPRAILLGLAVLSLSAGTALAQPAPAFPALLRRALETSPRLAEARAEIARAEALRAQAGVRPNPVLGVEVENVLGSGPYDGASLAETTASVAQTLELGGKRVARVEAAQAEVVAAQARARRLQAQFASELAAAYAAAEASQRRLQLAREQLGLAVDDARGAAAFVEAGREPELRRLQADAALLSARAAVQQAEAAQTSAFVELSALVGGDTITSVAVSLLDQQGAVFPGMQAATVASTVAAASAEVEAAERRVRLEQTRRTPDVTVSLGVRRFQEADATALLGGVSVPLPLFDRNRGNIAATRAEANAAQARLNAARLEAEAAVRAGGPRLAAADARLAATRAAEGAAQEAYRLTRLGFEGGKLGLIELLNARRALAEAREQTIAAAQERVNAQAAQLRFSDAMFGEGQ